MRLSILLLTLLLTATISTAQAEQRKTLGIILPLSGPLAEYGVAARNGFEMAREAAPALFENVNLSYEDSQYQSKEAISALQMLRRDPALVAIYVWGNHPSEAVAPLAEQYRIPTVAAGANPTISQSKSYIVRSMNHAQMFSELLAKHIRAKQYHRIAVVLAQNSYLSGIYSSLANALGTELILIDHFEPSDTDFRAAITKIRHGGFDSVAVFLMSGQVSQFYRQLQQQRVNLPTLGTDFFESTTEIEAAGPAMQGAVYAHIGTSPEFRSQYVERFDNDLQLSYAANGYDTATIIARALASTPDSTPESVIAAIKDQKALRGVSGELSYRNTDEGGAYFEFPVMLKRIVGSSFESIELP